MRNLFIAISALWLISANSVTSSIAAEASSTDDNATIVKDYEPVVSHFPLGTLSTWKTSERYDFSYILGLLETYNPDEQVVFSVEGKSDKLFVDKTNGFEVAASMIDPSENKVKRLDIKYNEDRRFWQVKFNVPHVSNKEYRILLNLYCKKMDSPCSEAYGFGTQVDKVLKLKVR